MAKFFQAPSDEDMLFLLAAASALVDLNMAALSEHERNLVNKLKSGITISRVRINLPKDFRAGDGQDGN